MGRRINLEVRCPKNVRGIAFDPDPDWSFDDLLSELNGLENKLTYSLKLSSSSAKTNGQTDAHEVLNSKNREVPNSKDKDGVSRAFVMRVSDEEMEIDDHLDDKAVVAGRRFASGEHFVSDNEDSEIDSMIGPQRKLMPCVGFVEGTLSELTNDRQLAIMEEIRNQKMDLELRLMNENEKFASNLARTEKYVETKRELERKFDLQYQRRIAEALDTHLTAVQRDHEHKSQIEERKIRADAVREEAQRRERALYEEKLRQEKIEAEAQARLEAERAEAAKAAKAAALEAERRAAEDAAQKKTSSDAGAAAARETENATEATAVSQVSLTRTTESAKSTVAGNLIRSAETALKLEERRLQIYEEVSARNHALKLGSNLDYGVHERNIKRNIRTMRGSEDNVMARSRELVTLINQPALPQSISIMMFVDVIVAQCNKPTDNRSLYAYGRSIVLVSSKVPLVMDMLIAKLNKVCIYTVPKHVSYSKSVFATNEAYYKAIGFEQEDDGKIESVDSFLGRMTSCMKLYGALVQTEMMGTQNLHGLEEGWAWLARFLNALPPNLYTAVALYSFLEMAGYAMYKRFKRQFMKLVRMIDRDFVEALQEDLKSTTAIHNFRNYLKSNQFLKEPEERALKSEVMSRLFDV